MIVRSAMIKEFKKRDMKGDIRGEMINEIDSYKKCVIPIYLGLEVLARRARVVLTMWWCLPIT